MICQYCLEDKKLCKAHLLPEAFFRFMYPEDSKESLVMFESNSLITKKRPIGIYDAEILCADCDNKIGKLDEYGIEVFLKSPQKILENLEADEGWVIPEKDPLRIKLFILSVIWRFAISNFEDAKDFFIPEKFKDQIRNMMLQNNPGGIHDFSVFLTQFRPNAKVDNISKRFFLGPVRERFGDNGLNYIKLWIPNGFKAIVKMDSRPQIPEFIPVSLEANKPVYLLRWENFEESRELALFIKRRRMNSNT